MWGLLRVFWCYGGERYWNFCGHMIKDRAHPLANFIQAYNQRRAVDNIPPAWIDEVLTYSATNKLNMAKDAVEHLRVEAPEPEYDVRQLLLKSTPTDAPELTADPAPAVRAPTAARRLGARKLHSPCDSIPHIASLCRQCISIVKSLASLCRHGGFH